MPNNERYRILLRPLSWLYGMAVGLRNWAFDYGILHEQEYPIPIICVGNISAGGTGKTPHIEYILSLLARHCKVAVISRGYRRQSKGLVFVRPDSLCSEVGDEPKQIKLKYPAVLVLVDANRRRAMEYLMALPIEERPKVVLMDDGLQHRYVKPSYRIMLMDLKRPIDEDKLLPEGLLREPASARYRMDCIIVTKCPESLKPIERRGIERGLAVYNYQPVFFSTMQYLPLRSVKALLDSHTEKEQIIPDSAVLALSGIAQPQSFEDYLSTQYKLVGRLRYKDHHYFNPTDLETINKHFVELRQKYNPLYIVCTEKDAVRLLDYRQSLDVTMLDALYYLPITVQLVHKAQELDRLIWRATKIKPQSLQDI